jgi:hypothetical protein
METRAPATQWQFTVDATHRRQLYLSLSFFVSLFLNDRNRLRSLAQEGKEDAEVGVYYCDGTADPGHWAKCAINAWTIRQLLGTR